MAKMSKLFSNAGAAEHFTAFGFSQCVQFSKSINFDRLTGSDSQIKPAFTILFEERTIDLKKLHKIELKSEFN